jgi:hypothetical protein
MINIAIESLIGIFIATGLVTAIGWLRFIRDYASCLIWFTLILSTASALVTSITFYSMGDPWAGTTFLLIAICHAIYCYVIRRRVEFSATILSLVVYTLSMHHFIHPSHNQSIK